MENRRNWTSKELASAQSKFRGFGSSGTGTRDARDGENLNAPVVDISIQGKTNQFQPSDFLACEYVVKLRDDDAVRAIETSVIWITEGKGEEDIGVHFFERRSQQSITMETFNHIQRLSTVLPPSPLSYDGRILKIRWCVRVRLFMEDGSQVTEDRYFQLGTVKPFDR